MSNEPIMYQESIELNSDLSKTTTERLNYYDSSLPRSVNIYLYNNKVARFYTTPDETITIVGKKI